MEGRKRENSFRVSSEDEPKRFRPEEILGSGDGKVMTRLLVNKDEFSRLIGKGGQTIALIRTSTGVSLKGQDVDGERRLVLISGRFNDVIKAFELVSDLLHQSAMHGNSSSEDGKEHRYFTVHVLLEHSKAGKAVGTKGAMMQAIKNKSSVHSLRLDKEAMDYSGVLLRDLAIEGNIASIRRAHFHLLDLFYGNGSAQSLTNGYDLMGSAAAAAAAQHSFASGSGIAPMLAPGLHSSSVGAERAAGAFVPVSAFLPLSALVEVGVQPETVRQLVEMKAYLQRHFGVNLCCTRGEEAAASVTLSGAVTNHGPASTTASASAPHSTIAAALAARREVSSQKIASAATIGNVAQEVCFAVPKSVVGGLIAKNAQGLKDLQEEFAGVRVYVEKEEVEGQRLVVLFHQQLAASLEEGGSFIPADEVTNLLQRCEAKIHSLVESLLQQQATSQTVEAAEGSIDEDTGAM